MRRLFPLVIFCWVASAQVDAGPVDGGVVDAGGGDAVVVDVGVGVVDADAGVVAVAARTAAGTAGGTAGGAVGVDVVIDDRPTSLVFFRGQGARDARQRASDARSAIQNALELDAEEDVVAAQVVVHEGTAIIRVRGRAVATLDEEDAKAAGSPSLVIYGDELETRLLHFVDEHRERHSLQQLAFHVFFSVFLVLLGFLTLRGLNRAFARADTFIEDRDHRPLSVFDVQVLSADAVRGLLATVLLMGRALAAVVVVVVVIAAVLAQFEATRPLLQRIAAAGGRPLLSALETVIAALPGLVLAALLLLLLRGALRFVRVLLDGVAAGRVSSSWLAGAQAPVARPVLSVALVVVALPLVVAAAFGRFGTPIETLALTGSAVVFLAALPVLAAAVVGLSLVWRGAIKVGDWVVVGDDGAHGVTGEVTSLGVTGVVLVPAGGGTVVVPSLLLLVRPLRRIGDQPPTAIEIRVRRTQKIAAHVAVVERIVRALDEAASVVVVDADDTSLLIRLSVPAAAAAEPATILRAVLVAVDDGTLELAPRGG